MSPRGMFKTTQPGCLWTDLYQTWTKPLYFTPGITTLKGVFVQGVEICEIGFFGSSLFAWLKFGFIHNSVVYVQKNLRFSHNSSIASNLNILEGHLCIWCRSMWTRIHFFYVLFIMTKFCFTHNSGVYG